MYFRSVSLTQSCLLSKVFIPHLLLAPKMACSSWSVPLAFAHKPLIPAQSSWLLPHHLLPLGHLLLCTLRPSLWRTEQPSLSQEFSSRLPGAIICLGSVLTGNRHYKGPCCSDLDPAKSGGAIPGALPAGTSCNSHLSFPIFLHYSDLGLNFHK